MTHSEKILHVKNSLIALKSELDTTTDSDKTGAEEWDLIAATGGILDAIKALSDALRVREHNAKPFEPQGAVAI